jgi:hypothetical protein
MWSFCRKIRYEYTVTWAGAAGCIYMHIHTYTCIYMHIHAYTYEDEADEAEKPPLIPAGCTCKWCMKWMVCEHTVLVPSVFIAAYQVPDKLVAETLALRKETRTIREAAGLKRKLLIKEIARQKKQSTNRLAYMDQPVHPQPAPLAPPLAALAVATPPAEREAAPRPAEEAAAPAPAGEAAPSLIVPPNRI